jgi:hypothetical protein
MLNADHLGDRWGHFVPYYGRNPRMEHLDRTFAISRHEALVLTRWFQHLTQPLSSWQLGTQ